MTLCQACRSINFTNALCCPGEGGSVFQTWSEVRCYSEEDCKLCSMIIENHDDSEQKEPSDHSRIICNLWNYYEGDQDCFKGSHCIVFSIPESSWCIKLGIYVEDEGLKPDVFKTARMIGWLSTESPLAKANLISGRPLQISANSRYCFSLIQSWMEDCLETHKESCPHNRSSMPTRVIDVASLSKDPFLLITNGEVHPWVSLSHCWGQTVPFVTTTKNILDMRRAIPFHVMPLTFQHAVAVTRILGYRYLWIDSLCIMQDSDTDWQIEAARMQRYYKEAMMTINTDLAAGDHEGFLDYTRDPEQYIDIPFMASPLKEPAYARIRRSMKDNIHREGSYLTARAWTLQECVLSPRTIRYTAEHLVWECQKHMLTETNATPNTDLSVSLKRYFLQPQSAQSDPRILASPEIAEAYGILSRWYILLESYCQRKITFEDDRLYAISGLAREIQQQTQMTYIVGLWKEDFLIGLLWSIDCRGRRPVKYRAPSFSWASLDISASWGCDSYPAFELYGHPLNWDLDKSYQNARWLNCELEPEVEGNIYGSVRQGSLKLRGLMMDYKDWKGSFPTCFNVYWSRIRSHLYWIFPVRPGIRSPEAADQLICSLDEDLDDDDDDDPDAQANPAPSSPSCDRRRSDSSQHNSVAVSHPSSSSTDSNTSSEKTTIHQWQDSDLLQKIQLFQIAWFKGEGWITRGKKSIVYALMLQPCEREPDNNNDKQHNIYRRVGIAEVPDVDGLAEIDWKETDITII